MNPTLQNALLDAWAVLSPINCAGCDADDRALCPACRAALCLDLRRGALPDGTPVFSALRYSGPVRRTILAFKEQGRTDVARALARPLRQALA
ncbi:MAG TPA: ComF family protein, partial [Terrimesophilobacter sp.]|nr:ComF family protein [Terrimesophilobacter sp.]